MDKENLRAFATTAFGSLAHVGFCGILGRLRVLPDWLTRKLMHIGAGPLFALCWRLYPPTSSSKFLAASVPLVASLKFFLVGKNSAPDVLGLVKGATRTGRREELLQGPLLYGIVHAIIAVTLWNRRKAAAVGIGMLCFGDGAAEVVGSSLKSPALPWNTSKTLSGSLACLIFGYAGSAWLTQAMGEELDPATLGVVAIVSTLVESLPVLFDSRNQQGLDNITVPLSAILTLLLLVSSSNS